MHVFFTARARAALFRMAKRWKEKARVPETFANDIDAVTARLATAASAGVVARRTGRRTVYRVAAERTRLHLYYVIDDAKQVVTVLQVWSQWRSRPPRL